MSGTTPRPMQEPDITWTMPLSLARNILGILAKQPYEQINGVIKILEDQGNEQLKAFEQRQGRPNGENHVAA